MIRQRQPSRFAERGTDGRSGDRKAATMKILLLSAYDAASHRSWHTLLRQYFCDCEWTVLTLPPRYFSWRQRGNSLSWAYGERERLQQRFDLVLATSMVDLSALRGLVPALAAIPTIVYFHENQFAYPASDRQFDAVEPRLLNLYTALAADRVLFNSTFNRDSFLAGAAAMLQRFPDCVPPGLCALLAERSAVLPVPLAPASFAVTGNRQAGPLRILWNHRWEYDKGPEHLLTVVRMLAQAEIPATLAIVGQQFRTRPPAFAAIKALVEGSTRLRIDQWGYVAAPAAYRQILGSMDVVLSTALHDFQGLAVLEAVAAGCSPLVPDRLCYPEWFAERYRYPSVADSAEQEARGVVNSLRALAGLKAAGELPVPAVNAFSLDRLGERYRREFEAVSGQNAHGHWHPK